MFAKVRLLHGYQELLTYSIPDSWGNENLIGSIVKVPIQKKQEFAVILETFEELDINTKFKIREIDHLEDIPSDKSYFEFLERLASYYCLDSIIFLKRIRKFLDNKELEVEEIIGDIKYIPEALNSSTQLTKDQT